MARNPTYIIPPGHKVGEPAEGPTHGYRVTPQRTTSFVDGLRRGAVDLDFHTNGDDNESGLDLGTPGIFNGNRYGYSKVYQGPHTEPWQRGKVALDGSNTLHRHISEGVANADWKDLVRLHERVMDHGDENTMSVTDGHGNIAVFGLPETLLKRGFTADQFMAFEDERKVEDNVNSPAYRPFMKVLVPRRD